MSPRTGQLLRQLHRLTAGEGPAPDAVLLSHFVRQRDEAAFAELARRHGPMVLAVCRRTLSDEQWAEDAFQATFLVLARKAAAVRPASPAAWLHSTARHLALRCRRAEDRRRHRESGRPAAAPPRGPLDELSAREALLLLDEELARLPEAYRLPLVLCALEGRTADEAARLLGCSPGSIRGRLGRGRARLHARLARRGLTLTAVLGLLELARAAAPAGPPAAVVAAARAGEVPARVAALAEGAGVGLAAARAKLGLALLLAVTVVAAGAGLVAEQPPPAAAPPGPGGTPTAAARTDRYGDPLPEGALARLGTVQLRHRRARGAFSPDGKSLLTVGADQAVRSWDVATGRLARQTKLRPVRGETELSGESLLAPGGKLVAAWGKEAVHLYDAATGEHRHRLPTGWAGHHQLAFSPDGKVLATMVGLGGRYTLRLWDVPTGKQLLAFKERDYIDALAFSPDGKLLASPVGKQVLRWDTATGREMPAVPAEAHCLAFSPDGKTAATADRNGVVTLWESAAWDKRATLRPTPAVAGRYIRSPCLAFSPEGSLLALGGLEAIVLWDVAGRKERRRLPDRNARWLAFAPDGKALACAAETEVRLWDVGTGERLHHRPGHDHDVWCVAASPDGKVVATACADDPFIRLWAATGEPLRAVRRPTPSTRSCVFTADGKQAVSGGAVDLALWDVATGTELRRFRAEDLDGGTERFLDVITFRLSADGRRLAALCLSQHPKQHYQINVWEVATGKVLTRRHFRGGFSSRFTADGEAVTVDGRLGLTVEDTTTGRELATVPGDLGHPVDFAPDGKLVAVGVHETLGEGPLGGGYRPKGVRVAELATGQEVFSVEGWIDFARFSPDGRVLATADAEGLRVWDALTGERLFRRPWPAGAVPGRLRAPVNSLAFLPGGRAVVTGMPDGTALVWDLAPQTWPAPAAGRALGPKELEGLWADLGADARAAHRAIRALAAAPARAVPFLAGRLRPAGAVDAKRVERLIGDLDNDRFEVRDAAAKELTQMGEQVEPALRRVLEGKPAPEVRKRVQAALAQLRGAPPAAALRALRATQALERVGTPEARRVLEGLSRGAAADRLTREAQAALRRLAGPPAGDRP
jgi:RNA polymerase sigma factor (sigma-70 family)